MSAPCVREPGVRELLVSLKGHSRHCGFSNCLYCSSLLIFLRGVFHIIGGAIYLSGIDMIHGTPVLDIKPYIADYDSPQNLIESLGEFNLHNNQRKPKTISWSNGKTDSFAQQRPSEYDEPQPCNRSKEKPKCLKDRTSGKNGTQHDTAKIQRSSPKHREIAADLALGHRSGQSPSVAEEQMGSYHLEKNFSEEDADQRLRRGKEAVVPQENGAEVQPVPLGRPARLTDVADSSVVPTWVREAPVATLEVRFTPHAEMDLGHLISEGESGISVSYF